MPRGAPRVVAVAVTYRTGSLHSHCQPVCPLSVEVKYTLLLAVPMERHRVN